VELGVVMNAGRILCSILLGMYAIYIIRNNTITILKQNLNEYFMCKKGKSYGISIIGIGRIAVSVGQSILLILLAIFGW